MEHSILDSVPLPVAPTAESPVRAFAVVRFENRTWIADLPADQWLDIGRAETAQVRIDSKDVAAVHGQVRWDQQHIHFRSASRAVAFVNGKKHQGTVELLPGDEITLGPVQLVIGISAPPGATPRRALTHQEFRERLWEETARAYRGGRQTTLVMVHAKAGEGSKIATGALQTFRAGDVVGAFAHDELEFLLPDTSIELARTVVARMLASVGVPAAAGMAVAPQDGDHPERLIRAARKALLIARRDGGELRAAEPVSNGVSRWLTFDPSMERLQADIVRLAATEVRVMFTGEIGSGKRRCAAMFHQHAAQASGPFIVYRCSAYFGDGTAGNVDSLERAFERAGGGTLVLADACELAAAAQTKVCKLAQSADRSVRLLSTTHRNLASLVDRGLFLAELYDSLVDEILEVPALRERPADIIPLARQFLQQAGGADNLQMGLGALARLQSYSWSGNLTELRNAMERAALLASGGEILAEHLPMDTLPAQVSEGRLREHVDSVERDAIIKALADTNHNQTHAAKRLGVSRRALIYKLEKYGLKRPPGTIRKSTRRRPAT